MEKDFYISTNKSKLDIPLIHSFLTNESYWAKGRSLDTVRKTIENSLCFGVYKEDEQVGFARVVTDYAVFAWIMDVFILPEYRKLGLGKKLMEAIMSHEYLRNLYRWGLATEDAHSLYEKYGFRQIKKPGIFMEIVARQG